MEINYNMATVFTKKEFDFSCIYKLTSPSGKIYIGQTQCLYLRFRSYRKMYTNEYLKKALLKNEREQFYFDTLQPFGDNGYNICKEAGTTRGRKRPPEEMKGLSDFNKTRIGELNHFYGKKHSEETLAYLREINLGKKQPQEWVDKRLANTDETKRYKCVKQMDLITKEVIAIFASIKEASNMTSIGMSNISQVANKRTCKRGEKEWLIKSAGGFYWEWCD